MAELPADVILEFQAGLSKLNIFLQNTLSNEFLSSEADVHKKECVTLVEGLINSLNNMKNSNIKDENLLNGRLSISSLSLDETNDSNGITDQGIPRSGSLPDMSSYVQPEDSGNWQASKSKKSDNNPPVSYVNGEAVENGSEKKGFPALPKRPDEVDGEQFGEDIYEAVANQKAVQENFQDDGFATDEFDSGSSDGGDVSTSPQTQPVQKTKKTKQFFKWLKKKAKKDKLFSSPEDGVALAGYAYKSNDSSKRWFLIREQKLHCFKTIKDEDPEITFDLNGSEIKVGEEEKAKLSIQVLRDGAIHFTLVAKNLKDWERWKKAFLLESGFIQLAVSPTDTNSGFYDQEEDEEEGDYVTPVVSPGLEKTPIPTSKTFPLNNNNETYDEDLYMEVVPSTVTTVEKLKSPSPSSSLLELGPLPPLPPDLLPRNTPDGAEGDTNEENCPNISESEDIYEEVSSSVANADKVIKWQGLNSKKLEVCPAGVQGKPSDKAAKGPVPAGVLDGGIEDSAMTASSFLDSSSKPSAGRLNSSVGAWCTKGNDKQQYLQIDLGEVDRVCGVATQGRPGFLDQGGWFVKTYTLAYSKNGENWANYKEFGIAKVFQGNSDPDTVVTNMLKMAVNARYVRVKPQSWHNHIAMRVEVYKGEASSKLTAGIHKLADTLTKTTRKKAGDRQRTTSSPVEIEEEDDYSAAEPTLERKGSFDEKVKYIDRPSSEENLLDGDEERDKGKQVTGLDNEAVTNDEGLAADDYLQLVREPTEEEKQVELKVQQSIEARRNGEQIGRCEVSQGIKAKKSLYEQTETTQDQRKDSLSKGSKENVVVTKKEKYIVEKREVEEEKIEGKANNEKKRNSSDSSQRDPDIEREELEKTEKAFQKYAKQLKEDGGPVVKEKRASIVALNRLNFEDPRSASKAKENGSYLEKMESLLKEKEELLKKMENLKKRLSVAKDRKIFFSLSTSRSKATTDADAEFHESQNEMAKTKKRLLEIENETKNLKVMELRYQKTPEKTNPDKLLLRRSSRECKLGSVEVQSSRVAISSPSSGKEKEEELAQAGSVLSQVKAFEQMKKK